MNGNTSKTYLGLTREQVNEYAFPLLLAISVSFASLYTFNKPSAYVLTAVYAFASVYLFRLFDRLRQMKSGGFVYALIFTVLFAVSFGLIVIHAASFGIYSPLRWFYAQDDADTFQPLLTAAMFVGGGFFLTSVIYYFTVVRFRTMGVMLCTMFPFFFFAKRSDIMPDALTTLIMLLFLAVIIHNKRLKSSAVNKSKSSLKIDRAYIISIAVFILITGAITMAAEKPYYEAFLEKNSRFFNPFNMNVGSSSVSSELSERSSPRNASPSYSYEPIFYFETDSAQSEFFLRTKAFDYFNSDVWLSTDTGSWHFYSQQMPEYSTDDVVNDFSALAHTDTDGLYTVHTARVFDEDFTPRYLPAPYGTITDDRPAGALKYYKSSSDTSVIRSTSYYYLETLNDSFSFIQPENSLYELAKQYDYSSEEYLRFLDSFGNNAYAKRLRDDYLKAKNSYTDLSNVSQKLINLSREITKDCKSDLEKARKLESYFSENGFEYSLDYVPRDNSVDYFVFESKTGYCAGYATAMTLMARAVGLPARYTEGFAAFEKDAESGSFVIRDGYAHAFVEVYIPAAGWLTFDPTVSDYKTVHTASENGKGFGIISKVFNALNRVSVIFVIAAILIVFALIDRIKERIVRLLIHFVPINNRIIYLYGNLIDVVGISVGESFSAYTPDMLREYLSQTRGAVPERLIALFEKTAFGGYDCSKEEFDLAYKEYKQCYKLIRRPPKNGGNRKETV